MALSLGTVVGQIRIDISQASAAYAAVRAQHAQTLGAMNGSAATFNKAGLIMAGAGTVMVGAFAKAAGAAAEFEKRLDFFGAVSNTTTAQMEQIRTKALQLGQDTKYSANEIADSFIELGKAGVSASDIIDGVGQAVANLGASADIPLSDAANIITSQIQAFHLSAKDAVHVADQLQGAANASIAEVQDLGVSLKYVGGVAAAVHIPFESTVDAISLLAKAGIRGSTAGTSLRQMLVSLQGNSDKAKAKLEELGIVTADGTNKFIDAQGHIKPLAEVFQILQDHTKGLTEAERLMAFKTIFNNRALAAANILTSEGAEGFAKMHAAIGNTTAADVAAKRMDNLSGDIEILRGNIETFLIKGGTPFQNFLRGIVQGITKVVQVFGSLPDGVQTAIFAFLGIAGTALLLIGAFNLVAGQVLTFMSVMLRLGPAFKFLITMIKITAFAFRILTIAMLANPFVLIIAAIIALVALFVILYKKSETFRNAINSFVSQFIEGWNQIIGFFKGLPGFFSGVWDKITQAFQGALDWVRNNWPLLLAIITGPLGLAIYAIVRFKDQIIGFFKNLWDTVRNATVNGVTAVLNFMATLPEKIGYALGYAIGFALRLFINGWKLILQAGIAGGNAVSSFISTLPGRIAKFFTQIYTQGVQIWNQFFNWLKTSVRNGVNAVISFFSQLPGRVASLFHSMSSRAGQSMTSLLANARSKGAAILNGIVSFIRQLPGRVGAFFSSMVARAGQLLQQMIGKARSAGSSIVNGIMNGIRSLPSLISGVFWKAVNAIGNFASAALNKAKSIGSSIWNGFKAGLGISSPSYLERAMFQIRDTIGVELNTVKGQVKTLQSLGSSLAQKNPVSMYSSAVANGLRVPAGLTSAAQAAVGPGIAARVPTQRATGNTLGGAQGASGAGKVFNVTVNNPAPEPASDSLYRTHQKIIYLGLEEEV